MKKIFALAIALIMLICTLSGCNLGSLDDEVGSSGIEGSLNSEGETTTNETNEPTQDENNNSLSNKFKGDVWKAVLRHPDAHNYMISIRTTGDLIKYLPLPIRFLQNEGLIKYSNGEMVINGKTLGEVGYTPFVVLVATDKTTDANDVYLYIYYQSEETNNKNYEDVWTANWKLKYTLDDDDYNTLLALEGDFRARLFIPEMDKKYEPDVITKNIVTCNLTGLIRPVQREYVYQTMFPDAYVEKIDYENRVMTFAVKKEDGYAYIDINIDDSNAIDLTMRELGITDRQEMLDRGYYSMDTMNTILGECLTEFGYYAYTSRYSYEKSVELTRQAETVDKLEFYYAYSTDSKYNWLWQNKN